jgi:cell division protein FtsZ
MENNSTNRIKALKELCFEDWLSKIKISTNTETHIIGLGSGGTNAVKYLWSQLIKGRFTVVNNPDSADIPAGINLIPFHSPKILKFTGKKGDIYFPDMDHPLELPDEFTGLFREDCRFVIFAGLGGYTGTKMAEALSGMLQKEQRDFLTLCSMPFSFEGRSRLAHTREAMNRMKTIPNCHFFELDLLRNEHDDLMLSEAFPAGDRYFYKIINKLRIVGEATS